MEGEGNALLGMVDLILLTIILMVIGFFTNLFFETRAGKSVDTVAARMYRWFNRLPLWVQTTIQFSWGIGLSILAIWIYAIL